MQLLAKGTKCKTGLCLPYIGYQSYNTHLEITKVANNEAENSFYIKMQIGLTGQ